MDSQVEGLNNDQDVLNPPALFQVGDEAPSNFPTSPDTQLYVNDPELIRTLCDDHNSFHFQSEGSDVALFKDSHSNLVLQCLTCLNLKSSFYCYSCIKHGEFCSSKSGGEIEEKFTEKKLKYYLNLQVKSSLFVDISHLLERKVKIDKLESEINSRKRNIDRLKAVLQLKEKKLLAIKDERTQTLSKLKDDNHSFKEERCAKIEFTKKYLTKIDTKIRQKKEVNQSHLDNIKGLTWDLAYQLRSCIFTLDVYNPDDNETNLTNSEESVPLLGYYSGSGFDQVPSNTETKYTVIEPWISDSADITPYVMWVNRYKDEMTSSETLGMRNDAFRISAALANLCQITQVLSGILDLWLPRRLTFREFLSKPGQDVEFLTEEELKNKVAKLNANVSYLCLSQKLDPDLVNVKQSVKNIINLLNPSLSSDLGRRGPVELDPEFLSTLESILSPDLQLIEENVACYYSSQDCDQDFEMDFDMIPHWPGGRDTLPSPSDVSTLAGSYLPSPGILTSVFPWMFNRE